jgi:hypothetical protein
MNEKIIEDLEEIKLRMEAFFSPDGAAAESRVGATSVGERFVRRRPQKKPLLTPACMRPRRPCG